MHIERFNDIIGVHGLSHAQKCRVFSHLKSFEQMCKEFAEQFRGAMAPEDDMMELTSMN